MSASWSHRTRNVTSSLPGALLQPQGGHNSALAILIIGLGQLQSSLLAVHKMLPCAELLQRLALWALLDKHCSSQEVWVLGWLLVPAANLHLSRGAGSLAQGAAADFLTSKGLRTFFLESYLNQIYKYSMPSPSSLTAQRNWAWKEIGKNGN